jgi:hypothetical protein
MDAIREQLNKPLVAGIVGFIIGLIIGLPILGWGLWPVQYTDAAPDNLRADLQEEWLRMAITSYQVDRDPVKAQQRWAELGEVGPEVLQRVATNPGILNLQAITDYQTVIAAAPVQATPAPGETLPAGTPPVVAPVVSPTPAPGLGGTLVRTVLPIMCLITLLLAGALVAAFLLRGRARGPRTVTPAMQAQEAASQVEWTDYASKGEEPPMAQFIASYKLGDDLFDDSFSIDSPGGEFLGECGVGISETIGVGDPKKVTAFEVWLFDKNDIQTVTKVLMSAHAFNDETIRQRLAAKGEPVLANPGSQVVLETATLQLVARVVDIAYGDGPLPPDSFFDNLILELAVWQK